MAIHCDDLNLLYLCTDKTGSTSVSNALIDQLGGRWVPAEHMWDGGELLVDQKHSSLRDLVDHDLLDAEQIRSMHVAITVRNPFPWIVSGYRYRRQMLAATGELDGNERHWLHTRDTDLRRASGTFEEFVLAECELRDGSMIGRFVDGFEDHPSLTCMRIESIDADFNTLVSRLGVGWHIDVPHDNATQGERAAYRSMYSETARDLVEEHFAADLERFGYEF